MAFVDDLKERLTAASVRLGDMRARAEAERMEMIRRHETEQDELVQAIEAMERLLSFEAKAGKLVLSEAGLGFQKGGRQPLPEYIFRQVRMLGRVTKDDLRASAVRQGFFENGDTGGRSVHAALLNLVRGGRLQEVEGSAGIYELANAKVDVTSIIFSGFKDDEGPQAKEAGEPKRNKHEDLL